MDHQCRRYQTDQIVPPHAGGFSGFSQSQRQHRADNDEYGLELILIDLPDGQNHCPGFFRSIRSPAEIDPGDKQAQEDVDEQEAFEDPDFNCSFLG